MKNLQQWKIPEDWHVFESIEMHTGGEPLRVIVGGLPEIIGDSILDKIEYFRTNHDDIRKKLIWEPRGHADMYGCIIVPPVSPEADFGVLFLHNVSEPGLLDEQPDLLHVIPTGDAGRQIIDALVASGGANRIFLVDPLGNLILSY